MAESAEPDPLEALRAQLEATEEATRRLVRETATSARGASGWGAPAGGEGSGGTPPAGWEAPPSGPEATGELQALVRLFGTLREALPEDIQRQLTDLVRQLLLLVRALIDWWLSRLDPAARAREVEVQDIPIS